MTGGIGNRVDEVNLPVNHYKKGRRAFFKIISKSLHASVVRRKELESPSRPTFYVLGRLVGATAL